VFTCSCPPPCVTFLCNSLGDTIKYSCEPPASVSPESQRAHQVIEVPDQYPVVWILRFGEAMAMAVIGVNSNTVSCQLPKCCTTCLSSDHQNHQTGLHGIGYPLGLLRQAHSTSHCDPQDPLDYITQNHDCHHLSYHASTSKNFLHATKCIY
jgi:hypothetical protein